VKILTLLVIALLPASAAFAAEFPLVPSVTIGGVTELGNSFNPFYKFRLDATTPKKGGPLTVTAAAAVSTYQLPYYLAKPGASSYRQLVDEWKMDYQAAAMYSFTYDDTTYQLLAGGSGLYIDNKVASFSAAGPLAGFQVYGDNDWGRALIGMDITPYLYKQATYAAPASSFVGTSTSVFGKPVLSVDYKIQFTIPYDGYKMIYGLDGQMIKFDKSYRYYNGFAVALQF
jgi:hypothetical protein